MSKQKQPRRLADADVGMFGAGSSEQARALQQTFATGLHAAFVVCAVLAALGVVTALLRGAEGESWRWMEKIRTE